MELLAAWHILVAIITLAGVLGLAARWPRQREETWHPCPRCSSCKVYLLTGAEIPRGLEKHSLTWYRREAHGDWRCGECIGEEINKSGDTHAWLIDLRHQVVYWWFWSWLLPWRTDKIVAFRFDARACYMRRQDVKVSDKPRIKANEHHRPMEGPTEAVTNRLRNRRRAVSPATKKK